MARARLFRVRFAVWRKQWKKKEKEMKKRKKERSWNFKYRDPPEVVVVEVGVEEVGVEVGGPEGPP